jgi:serine-type D-Ala-D-Ala carboxypeptidase (penicillin-binding protein 5/6)
MSRLVVVATLAISLALPGPVVPARGGAPGVPEVTCFACIVVDDAGRVLWSRRPEVRLPNASTTKMVTALALRRVYELALTDLVEVSERAAATGGGGLDLAPHDVYPARTLLLALLLTSSNDAAVALAEHAAGRERAFVAAMNRVAAELGARRSHFVTPHGLDAPGHYSSAADLARIGHALLRDPILRSLVGTGEEIVAGPRGALALENHNPLIETYRGAVGIKTGFTAASGEVLVGAARRHGRTLVVVALRAEDAGRDARRLLDFGFARMARGLVVARGAQVGELTFDSAGSAVAVSARAIRGWAPPRAAGIAFVPHEVRLPVAAGDEVGRVEVRWRGRLVGTAEAVAGEPVAGAGPSWLAERLAGVLGAAYELVDALGGRV